MYEFILIHIKRRLKTFSPEEKPASYLITNYFLLAAYSFQFTQIPQIPQLINLIPGTHFN